jgi:hypothetical protein
MTKNKWIQDAIKHRGALRKTATKEGLIKGDEKLSMSDLNKLEKEGGKTAKQASLAKTLRSFADGGVIASNIIMQLGGFSRLQIMLGAYNFVDLKNGLSFKIKNARSNYIVITLNDKDLYDIEIGRIRGNTYKVVYKQEDVYAFDLKNIIENKTGMYMAFEDGGDVPMDMEILIISQVDKLANGGITALEVLEAREFVGEEDWKKMKPKERLSVTRYLVKTGKIGYYEKTRKYADGVQLNKYKVKYLIGYSDDEDALKYHEGKFYADSKDNVALEVFEHFKRLGYSHIEILGIMLIAEKGMEIKLTDEELNKKYLKLKGDLPNWFKDMPTRYKEEIIEEVEEDLEEKEFSNGGAVGSKRDSVINYYINNMEDDVLLYKFDINESYLVDRNESYSKIYDIISDELDDEDVRDAYGELNLGDNGDSYEMADGGFVEKSDEELKGMNDDEFFEYLDAKAAYMKQFARPLSSHKAKNYAANAAAIQYQNEGTSKLDENFPDIQKIKEQSTKDYEETIAKRKSDEEYKKGGALKYYNKENEYKIGRPSGYIEKEILSRVDSNQEDFVGSFGWKTENKKMADGYLYKLSDFDKELVKDIRLKSGEKIFRYFNRNSAIAGMKPLIKINLDKELLYFLKDINNIEFETRGVQAIWIALIEHKL